MNIRTGITSIHDGYEIRFSEVRSAIEVLEYSKKRLEDTLVDASATVYMRDNKKQEEVRETREKIKRINEILDQIVDEVVRSCK